MMVSRDVDKSVSSKTPAVSLTPAKMISPAAEAIIPGVNLPLSESISTGRDYKIFALLAVVLAAGLGLELLAVTLLKQFLSNHASLHSFLTLLSHAFTTAAVIGIVYDLLAR